MCTGDQAPAVDIIDLVHAFSQCLDDSWQPYHKKIGITVK